ncbi:MAG TPA: division/cell wall cluster transcriptional repressor MraZ [Candidatus Paceibacterota bacterium]
MFIGEYKHTLDPKKRLSVPSKFRKALGEKVVITRGLDACLFLYTWSEWEKVAEKLSTLPTGQTETRDFVRLMLSGAHDVELDSLGRVLIPDHLKEFAGLKEKVVIAGLYRRIEIWDESRWSSYKERVEKETDRLAEKLGNIGAF